VEAGERQKALGQSQRCRDVLRGQLGVDPSPETEALHREILEGGLAATPAHGDERALLLEELGDVMRRAGDATRSGPLYQEAATLLEVAGDAAAAMRVRGKAVLSHILGGEVAAAARLLEATDAAIGGNLRAMALCQHALGSVHFLLGRWPESRDELGRSVRLARSVGAAQGEVIGSQRLGLLETAMGDLEDGYRRLRQTVKVARASQSIQVRHHSFTRNPGLPGPEPAPGWRPPSAAGPAAPAPSTPAAWWRPSAGTCRWPGRPCWPR
jgi:hypothetical protein